MHVLLYSMLGYMTTLPSAKMEYLFQSLSRAVIYFGGVAEISKTDNMRQWIKKTDRYEPALNEAASQWCLHNDTELDECRSKKPLDKDPAESLVNQTYRYFYSRICRDTFFSYDELNSKLYELNDMFNNRTRRNKTYSRREQYEREKAGRRTMATTCPCTRWMPALRRRLCDTWWAAENHFEIDVAGQKGLFCTREFGDDSYIFEQIY